MRILSLFIAWLALAALCALVVGGEASIVIFNHHISGRLESALVVIVCSAALFGIYRRAKIVWWLGWIVLGTMWFGPLFSLQSPEWKSEPVWGLLLWCTAYIALATYFTYRWYRRRDYFHIVPSIREV